MKKLEYLSPSGISKYLEDKDGFYLWYLADQRGARDPQTEPMAVGSAFDAYVKSYLFEKLFGVVDPRYELRTLFEAQVEKPLWDWAWDNGRYVFEQYKQSGVLGDLMLLLEKSPSKPRFEFEVRGAVNGYREGIEKKFGEVVLLGKPDVDFVTKEGNHCLLDFKVNGYCSNYPKSPMSHYIRLRSAGRTDHGQHPKCRVFMINGMEVNCACYLENLDKGWARQLAIYGWLTGNPVGSEFITVIHQICCSPVSGGLPSLRIAEHVNKIGGDYQRQTFDLACQIWEDIKEGWFYKNLSKDESISRCKMLEGDVGPPLFDIPLRVR